MSSPQQPHGSSSPRVASFKRPSVLNPDHDPNPLATRGSGALVTLIRNRSNATLRESLKSPAYHQLGHEDDDHENTSLLGFLHRDSDDNHRRSAAEERRLSEIIFGPQMRSMRLIGNSNPRYQWERYWKTEAELQAMSKPIREYYERNNDLIRMYLYIDQLLDSSVPHDLLNEYHQALDASAFRPVDVPQTITEESPTPTSPPSRGLAYGSTTSAQNSSTEHSSSANSIQPKVKRTPKDIFRPTEATPLLTLNGHDEATDLEEGLADQPKPEIPWLEDGDVDSSDPIVTLAIWVNFVANAVLLLGKIIVVFSVPSVSVLASLVDAVLDFLSTAIVWTTTRLIAASQNDQHSYPVGRRRLEPLGVLVFSIVMVTSFCQVALEAIQRLMSPEHEIIQLGIPAISIMVGTVVIKGLCWLWCRVIKNSSVRALADDAMTDVIFNTGSILFPIVGFYAKVWWLDALGGLLLSMVVIINWSQTSMHHVRNLTGFSATSDERNLRAYSLLRLI
ncbi:cation diffusion facilitator 10, partial [Colletotrichum sojae]